MRPQKINDLELLDGMLNVFRSKGYEGTSLNDLAISSGLQKASLYHRFPKGKKQIASAVLNYANEALHKNIYEILSNNTIPTNQRILKVIENIDSFYEGGKTACILRSISLNTGIELFGSTIKSTMEEWINAFTTFGKEIGFNEELAIENAKETLIIIQGTLVVSRGVEDITIFKRGLSKIEQIYKK